MPGEPVQVKTKSTSPTYDDFAALVRDALVHLYDVAHLQRHPLARLVAAPLSPSRDAGKALRRLLLDTVEQLNPGDCPSPNDKEWRPYTILVRRYADGSSIEEIVDELGISLRQFHREHAKALQAVAAILWRHWQPESPESHLAPSEARSSDLHQEMDNLGVVLEPLNLTLLVESVMRPAQALAGGHHVQLRIGTAADPVAARADPTLARQALLGVLTALIRARPAGIEVVWGGAGENVLIEQRVQPPLPAGSDDLDQRLAAVAELMHRQGGRLEMINQAECLRAVRLTFGSAQGARVLLIDDNERVLQLFERYLTAEGYSVARASGAEPALLSVERDLPQAIVLDVMMRNVDGWQLLERLRAIPSLQDVPIIVCSVLNEADLAFALGAQLYLKKPVSQQQMLAALRQVLAESNPAVPPPTAL